MFHLQHVIGHGRAADQHVEQPRRHGSESWATTSRNHIVRELSDFIAVDRDPARRRPVVGQRQGSAIRPVHGSRQIQNVANEGAASTSGAGASSAATTAATVGAAIDGVHVLDLRPSQFAPSTGTESGVRVFFQTSNRCRVGRGPRCLGKQRRHAPRPGRKRPSRRAACRSLLAPAVAIAASPPLILASTTFDQWPWMQTSDVPTGLLNE